jgi:hypothetical protein
MLAVDLCSSSKQGRLGYWTFAVLITEPLTPKLQKVAQGFVLICKIVMGVVFTNAPAFAKELIYPHFKGSEVCSVL